MDLRWKHTFTSIVAVPSGSGKSVFVTRFITKVTEMHDTSFKNIFWCQPHDDSVGSQNNKTIQYRTGSPNMDDFDGSVPNLIVLDDIMRETNDCAVVLFTKGLHHRNLSVFFITSFIKVEVSETFL